MSDRSTFQIQKQLTHHWEHVTSCIQRLNNASVVTPSDPYRAIQHHRDRDDEVCEFTLGPVVLNLPERASDPRTPLYIVTRGMIGIDLRHFAESAQIRTVDFGSEAGYFRLKGNILHHIYGAHYDFSRDEIGHPVFHAQMKSFAEMFAVVNEHLGMDWAVSDDINKLLKNVRMPTAQMDVFSLLLQMIADHLISSTSSDEEIAHFDALVSQSKKLRGAGYLVSRMDSPDASACYRSVHWYPN